MFSTLIFAAIGATCAANNAQNTSVQPIHGGYTERCFNPANPPHILQYGNLSRVYAGLTKPFRFYEFQDGCPYIQRQFPELRQNSLVGGALGNDSANSPKRTNKPVECRSCHVNNQSPDILEDNRQQVCKHLYDFNVRFENVEDFIKEFNLDIHVLVFACVAALARKLLF